MAENSASNDCMIKAVDLCKYYGRFAAIENLNFEVPQRQVCALLGPNGAGKSTTMKLLTGFLATTSGQITIAGHDMQTDRIAASKSIGYLPENGPLYEEMTPRSSLKYHGKVRGLGGNHLKNRLDYVTEKCDLSSVWNKTINKLSRGYRQRVGMAQALLHDPDILILDEPTSGLDPNQLVGVRQLIRDLGENKTVLLSTHILQEVEVVCSRVLLINQGKLVFDGPLEDIGGRESMEQHFHNLTGFIV